MTQAETFIILQTLWDFFLICFACGVGAYWTAFWLFVFNDEPLYTEGDSLFVKLVTYCRELKNSKSR